MYVEDYYECATKVELLQLSESINNCIATAAHCVQYRAYASRWGS